MEHFENESRFSSWACLVSEGKESTGKKMSSRIRKGNKYLKACLVECARASIRNKQSYFLFAIPADCCTQGRETGPDSHCTYHVNSHLSYAKGKSSVL